MTTPEGRIKTNIDRVLHAFGVYSFMPVPTGYGKKGVDYHCAVRYGDVALAFFIEAKKPGGEPTGLQGAFLRNRREQQRAKTFVIDDDNVTLHKLVEWLEGIEAYNERYDTDQSAHVG
jgi:hypothetical protein